MDITIQLEVSSALMKVQFHHLPQPCFQICFLAHSGKVTFAVKYNSQVHSNVATFSASISSWNNSLFIAINCSLRQNSGRMGDGISIYARTVYLESCSLVENQATLNGGASLLTGVNLKVSNSMFVMNTALLGSDLYIETASTVHL